MIKLAYSERFLENRKKFVKGNRKAFDTLAKSLRLLQEDPQHPGLHFEKLKNSHIYSVRIDRGNRIFFLWAHVNTVLLIDLGPHDKYRRY